MSLENLKEYGKLCGENEEVRHKAREIGAQDIDGQIAYAKTLGLEFSKDDFEALAREAGIERKEELSEEDLKNVAGGAITTTLVSVALTVLVGGLGFAAAANKPGW